jgi:NADH-quinone oxidoreductase subunit N
MLIYSCIPEFYITLTLIFILLYGVTLTRFKKGGHSVDPSSLTSGLAVLIFVFAIILSLNYDDKAVLFLVQGLFVDSLLTVSRLVIYFLTLIVFILANYYRSSVNVVEFETYILIGYASVGMTFVSSCADFITFYLALELQSLAFYVLAASRKNNKNSTEAGLKYFMMGGLASGLLLFGVSIVYGVYGTIDFPFLNILLTNPREDISFLLASIFILSAVFFKISAFPFHFWTPDVYDGAPLPITAYFSLVPKIAFTALLLRFYFSFFYLYPAVWNFLLTFVGLLTLTIGVIGAAYQVKIKRFLAYSTISHVGFVLLGLSTGILSGFAASLTYLVIYLLVSVGVFAIIFAYPINKPVTDEGYIDTFYILTSFAKSNPLVALTFFLLILSLAGVPPLAGFFGKYVVLLALVEAKKYFVATVVALLSVLSAFYYLRLTKFLLLLNTEDWTYTTTSPLSLVVIVAVCSLLNLGFILILNNISVIFLTIVTRL